MQQQCEQGHVLDWTKKYISFCAYCGPTPSSFARYKCSICQTDYCVKCVVPPVYGDLCGGGHEIKLYPNMTGHSCDVCRQSIKGPAHRCQQCDYDVCTNCWVYKED